MGSLHTIWTCKSNGAKYVALWAVVKKTSPNHLVFDSPNVVVAFTRDAVTLPELTAQVPLVNGAKIKNHKARLYHSASIVRPTEVQHVQECAQWALRHNVGLTVVGGGHSSHCLWPNVVSVDMSAFDQVYIVTAGDNNGELDCESGSLVVAEAGCKTGDIVSKALEVGLTVPLGARPSVGAGLWLQGGIGHLARLHGLACDAIVGAVVISVASGQVLCIGRVPDQHQPANAVRPENESELLWAIKGAGSNFGIVVSVTFKTYTASTFVVRNWDLALSDQLEARHMLSTFQESAKELSLNCSADAYLYADKGKMHLGVTMFECSTTGLTVEMPIPMHTAFGPEHGCKAVDSVGLYDTEMYMCGMHGGHSGGKTSSFKRCVFLKDIGVQRVTDSLATAMETCPSQLCYMHLLQGGGAVSDVPVDATAFGCRDWDFACVVTGVWPRDQDETEAARVAERWVYNVIRDLLPLSCGIYGADLGPDPRDVSLAVKAFGSNLPRLARLKRALDPRNVLAFACPFPRAPARPKLIVLVTGDSCAGKDYCANIWVSVLSVPTDTHNHGLTARAVSISEETKRQYAAATGADLSRLLLDRTYKEQHRPALTAFFQNQSQQRPFLPIENFLDVVHNAVDVDVLLITGMRDEAPVAGFSHLVPDSRLIEIRVTAGEKTRRTRRGYKGDELDDSSRSYATASDHRPSFIFDNDTTGSEAATMLAEQHLLSFFDEDLQRLAGMVRLVPDFPRVGIEFRQQPGGLALCTSLLQAHFTGDWDKVDAVACCEAGGFIFASSLATQIDKRSLLLRKRGKLPPPTVSVIKAPSHISSSSSASSFAASMDTTGEDGLEMGRDVIPRGASVVVVEDVLATGKTLCAVLQLLHKAGIAVELASVMVVAEFPLHRGRQLLRQHGFGKVNIQSLLVFGGM